MGGVTLRHLADPELYTKNSESLNSKSIISIPVVCV